MSSTPTAAAAMLPQAEASTPGSFLYNELVDMVIDHLHDDKDALAACSLVSRLWRNSSQYHLLENVTLHGVATARGLDAFAAFVETSPRLAHYVRALRVHGEGSWFGKFEHDRMRELCLRPKHARFLARLPALRRLFLFEMLWDSSQDGTDTGTTIQDQTLDAHLRGSLEKLVLQHMTSLRFQQAGEIHYGVYAQDVLDVLSFFPDIKTLNFSTPRFEVGGPEESVAGLEESFLRLRFPPRLRVQSLIADADGMDSVRSALAYTLLDRACSVRSLHTFKAKVKPGDLEAVSHFVAVRSPFIRHYELDLSAYFTLARLGANETFSLLGLSACTDLESFELRTPCFPPDCLWPYIFTALSKLPPSTRRIRVHVFLTSTLPDSLLAASPTSDLLAHLPSLETLEFVLKHPYASDAAYPYRFQKCTRMLREIVPEPQSDAVLKISPCECFLVPSPEPVCMSFLSRSPSLD